VTLPDGTVIAGPPLAPGATFTIPIPAPAQIGTYNATFYAETGGGASSVFGTLAVTNSLNPAEVATYEVSIATVDPGDQATVQFTYSPAVIP
jgi:hypothetical protein